MSDILNKINKGTDKLKRDELKKLLTQLTEGQLNKFTWIFRESIEDLTIGQIETAIIICERQVKKNIKDGIIAVKQKVSRFDMLDLEK